ncbi:putative membrane protein [Phytomonospora endophytica]|uniref:Putative membrane protein n=1 Tax=Phytomonospora endophytica TaxID=714109 RepID=A0A841FGB8_9ACTN|nr:DUF4233 domain-containing protein [Phytomonospora endophytica]MBB6032888.1 putative membrane protein [Phytomonospora endophytica]
MEQVREDAVDQAEPNDADDATRSGLRDPQRAVRGLGAMVLALEGLVLLLAIAPLNMLDVPNVGLAIGVVVALSVASMALAGMMRRPWAWHAGWAVQAALLACYPLHWMLTAIGVVFALVWLYSLHVRRVLSRPPVRDL